MKFALFFLFIFSNAFLSAQTSTELMLSFVPVFSNHPLSLENQEDAPLSTDSLHLEKLQFYISQVTLYDGGQLVFSEEKSFHLLDAADAESLVIPLNIPKDLAYSEVRFYLGLDSLCNVSGAMGGDLDPTKGMYWTWQSGYINFKLEGTAKHCPARKNRFQFHLGGYQAPFNTLQEIALAVEPTEDIQIQIALDHFFKQVDLSKTYQIMSPNQEALKLAPLVASIFSIVK